MRCDVFKEILSTLRRIGGPRHGERAIEHFTSGVVGRLIRVRRTGSATGALHHLIARQLQGDHIPPHESWFQLGGRTVRFTPRDYALITGLHFGNTEFDTTETHLIRPDSLFHRHFHAKETKVSELRNKFKERKLGDEMEDYLKAANLLVYYYFLLCRDKMSVENWAWALVEDFEQWDRFPWGAYTYQVLTHYIDTVALTPRQEEIDYHFYGPVWVLQLWMYEAFPRLGRYCGTRDEVIRLPRCLMWETGTVKADFTTFFDQPVRKSLYFL